METKEEGSASAEPADADGGPAPVDGSTSAENSGEANNDDASPEQDSGEDKSGGAPVETINDPDDGDAKAKDEEGCAEGKGSASLKGECDGDDIEEGNSAPAVKVTGSSAISEGGGGDDRRAQDASKDKVKEEVDYTPSAKDEPSLGDTEKDDEMKVDDAKNSGGEPEETSHDVPSMEDGETKENTATAEEHDSSSKEQGTADSDQRPQQKAEGEEASDDAEEFCQAFDSLGKRSKKKRRKTKQSSAKPKSLSISIPSYQPKDVAGVGDEQQSNKDSGQFVKEILSEDDALWFDDDEQEEDPLSFYANTHEVQDPQYVEFHSKRLKKRLGVELAKLEKAKTDDEAKIKTYLAARWEERNDTLQRQINKVRVDMVAKQTRQRTQLSEKHKRSIESDQRKIDEGEKWLVQKQQMELEQQMSQHQQMNLPNNGVAEWNAIASQLQNKHSTQRSQFDLKKQEMKRRSEAELQAHNKILEAHHKKRQAEAETFIKDLMSRCRKQQETLKAKLSRLHEERFAKRRVDVQAECTMDVGEDSHSAQGHVQSDADSKHAAEPTAELHVGHKGGVHIGSISHDAVVRQKRRKNLLNNALPIQLAVEIHNEGIVVMTRSHHQEGEKEAEDANLSSDTGSGRSTTFLPWGSKSRSVLYSIVLGELPPGDLIGRAGRGGLGGGLVKCMITDSRTSEESASSERAAMLVQVQAARRKSQEEGIERQYSQTCSAISTLQTESALLMEKEQKIAAAHKEAALQFERAKQTLDKFRNQARSFFNQDGTPSPRVNPESQQKLVTAMQKYKAAYESTRAKEATLRQPLEMARKALTVKASQLQRLQRETMVLEQSLKKARAAPAEGGNSSNSKEVETLGDRIENIATSLNKIAERRRTQVNSNKSNSGHSESWENSMSSLSEAQRKSFHQKMLRRRITTLLRPSHDAMVADVKQVAKRAANPSTQANSDCFDICATDDDGLSSDLRTEQLLLLALHPPSANPPLRNVPDQAEPNQSWAEPGWQLVLDVPGFGERSGSSSILPVDTEGQLTQQFLSSCCSSGRQAASLIKPRHLRMLEAPMSFACRASAPAESDPSGRGRKETPPADSDPLSATDEKLSIGYTFVRPPFEEEEEARAVAEAKHSAVEDAGTKTTKKRRQSTKKADAKTNAPAKKRKSKQSKKQTKSTSPVRDNSQSTTPSVPVANIAVPNQGHQVAQYQQLQQHAQQAQLQAQMGRAPAQAHQAQAQAQQYSHSHSHSHLAQMRMLAAMQSNSNQQMAPGQQSQNQGLQQQQQQNAAMPPGQQPQLSDEQVQRLHQISFLRQQQARSNNRTHTK